MIVKTGANYHEEGGYIEASKTGTDVAVTIDGENYNFKSDAIAVESLYDVNLILKEPSSSIYCGALVKDANNFYIATSFDASVLREKTVYGGGNITIYLTRNAAPGVDNIVLDEGSRNVTLDKYSTSTARILPNGPNAVAIIKEEVA